VVSSPDSIQEVPGLIARRPEPLLYFRKLRYDTGRLANIKCGAESLYLSVIRTAISVACWQSCCSNTLLSQWKTPLKCSRFRVYNFVVVYMICRFNIFCDPFGFINSLIHWLIILIGCNFQPQNKIIFEEALRNAVCRPSAVNCYGSLGVLIALRWLR
jgi:hypothetical protein